MHFLVGPRIEIEIPFCYSESPVVKETAQTVRKDNKNSLFKKKGREKEKEKEQDKEKRKRKREKERVECC